MADFITRLVGRAMGTAQVVQPLVALDVCPGADQSPRPMRPGVGQETRRRRATRTGRNPSRPTNHAEEDASRGDTETIQGEREQGACPRLRRPTPSGPGCPPDLRRPAERARQNAGLRLPRRIGGMSPRTSRKLSKVSWCLPSRFARGQGCTRREEVPRDSRSAGSPRGTSESRLAPPLANLTRRSGGERDRRGGVAPLACLHRVPGSSGTLTEGHGAPKPSRFALRSQALPPSSHLVWFVPDSTTSRNGPPGAARGCTRAPCAHHPSGHRPDRGASHHAPSCDTYAATAPPTPRPELSLDDYLKQRNGGQR